MSLKEMANTNVRIPADTEAKSKKRAELLMGILIASDALYSDRIVDRLLRYAEATNIEPGEVYAWLTDGMEDKSPWE